MFRLKIRCVIKKIQKCLSPDLLKPEYLAIKNRHPLEGHCYVAAEAVYHLLGGKKKGLTAVVAKLPKGGTHWWIKTNNGIIDPTKEQFGKERIPYELGKPTGFLTRLPSKRCKIVLERYRKNERLYRNH
jgi:hypothetical protein